MQKSTSLKIHNVFGSLVRILFFPILMTISAFSTPLSLKNTPYFQPSASVNIVTFYTSWCPPCKKTLSLMEEMTKKHPNLHISTINVESPMALKDAKKLGLGETIPYILIADHSGMVVKRFQAIPDKTILNALIQRLEEGRLENGTLPPEQRIDSWKQNRKGM
ncbi:MAG: thioredoxin family protein [Sulfuricurvum sp.]|uniref:TlpA family protein disulfide reductase n=1 Tax=Sulfuricurvum sp. TaxID=2025608 RepID=UPI0026110FDB|nr:thioredoxin family protein [Sulfuricurvum sp.]MDD2828098.1 thioredoxin family protein [Sulfuricurvum sp.]MDD4948028.1 thioredoxin family protein [Sulfuricurvum sp.]